ncbi:carboxylesterase family protein [Arthrobacter sp. I2-34]|uniref:Carboxylesterase family protein n=1 Tax=Arthrobacter hankyongi TaxID=2904801 RepID=A0ABS9LEC7_9MICC|nr:carboxylesterase family protein [Arthrobacter hankyongi]MCG2624809.1 carboxylesterase family protein [Arthrobacter hankyongi]
MGTSATIGITANGLRGRSDGGVTSFLGIRYAKLDAGVRFGAPVPAAGQLDAARPAEVPVFPQLPSRLAAAMGSGTPNPQDDDAFFLNVWAPEGADKLPVLFFIHGGAWTSGGGANEWYDGARLAAQGLVVVTVNYRLGPVGLLAPAGHGEPHLPLQDLLCALRWVNANVAALGGDPERVTVAGQSAGGWYGHLLTLLPETRGLLRRAAHLSMATRAPWDPARHRAVVSAAATRLDGAPLHTVPAQALLRAGAQALRATTGPRPLGHAASGYLPTASPDIPGRFLDPAWCAGSCHAEAVLFRYSAEETGTFFFNSGPELAATATQVDEWLAALPPADLPPGLAVRKADPYETLVAVSSWVQFQRFPTELAAAYTHAGIPAELRVFTHRSALPGLLSGHCLDLPFQFGNRQAWADAPMLQDLDDDGFEAVVAQTVTELAGFVTG